jgi:hypothetical protein
MIHSSLSRGHSAHIGPDVEVHYRWHAFYGRRVRRYYSERRSSEPVVCVEATPGDVVVVPAWMLDPVVCGAMDMGTAQATGSKAPQNRRVQIVYESGPSA